MKVAYIFDDSKIQTGAHHINRLIIQSLKKHDISVIPYYPKTIHKSKQIRFRGLKNILFFYSLIEQKKEILKSDLIQGTTYTPLGFCDYGIPVVCHFGSTTWGMIKATPQTHRLESDCKNVINKLKNAGAIPEVNIKSRRPMRDIAEVELYTSLLSDRVIATSKIVQNELINHGVPSEKINVIYNAIEDFWFEKETVIVDKPRLVFLGRVGGDVFNVKLKGVDRLISIYNKFPNLEKISIMATNTDKLNDWMDDNIINHKSLMNLDKLDIVENLNKLGGSFILITSRYEGFSLSLVEAMSQGLIPITYSVGIAPEIIENNNNGFIVKTIKAAEKIINNLYDKPKELERLSKAAIKTASIFRGEKIAKELKSLYTDVIEKNSLKIDKSADEYSDAMNIVKKDELKPLDK